jgi:hypothetical protein
LIRLTLFLCALAFLLLTSPVSATTAACPTVDLPSPSIEIAIETEDDPPIDRSLTVLELTRHAREVRSGHSGRGRVAGLTTAEFPFTIDALRVAAVPHGDRLCAAPVELRIRLVVRQKVYVVRSSQPDPCWSEAILEHEMLHVSFNNEAVHAIAETLGPALDALLQAPPLDTSDLEKATQRLQERVQALVRNAAQSAFAEARRRHAEIDHPGAYDRVRHRCGI